MPICGEPSVPGGQKEYVREAGKNPTKGMINECGGIGDKN
jgi:hypothetical protein